MEGGDEKVMPTKESEMHLNESIGSIGDVVSRKIRELSPKYNNGKAINVIEQNLGYLVRGGDPDAIDAIVPMAFGNLALDLILKGIHGRLVILRNGRYDNAPLDVITSQRKTVDVKRFYNTERYRPHYKSFEFQPLFIMTGNLS
jgi:6-phosphofructokinase 1